MNAKFEEALKQHNALRKEVVEFLREKELTYDEAIEALKNAQSFLERASMKNRI